MLPPNRSRRHLPSLTRKTGTAGLAAALLVLLAACGSSSSNSSGTPGGSATPNETSSPGSLTLTAPASVASAGVLTVCADITYPPFTFMVNNTPTGIDVDVATALATAMGVKVQWIQTGYQGIVGALQGGKCDAIVNGINGTPEQAQVISQVPYMQDTKGFIVKKGNPDNIQSIDNFSGKSVATQQGGSTNEYLDTLNKQFAAAGKSPMTVVALPQDTAAFASVIGGRVNAYFQDGPVLAYYAQKYPDVEVLPISVAPQTNVIGIRLNDTALTQAATEGIKQMYKLGIMNTILQKWHLLPANYLTDMPGPLPTS